MTNPFSKHGFVHELHDIPALPIGWSVRVTLSNIKDNADEIHRVEEFIRNREPDGEAQRS